MTFNQAFVRARKQGKKTFSFNGRTYHTKTVNEMEVPTRVGYESNKLKRMYGINPILQQTFNENQAKNWMQDQAIVDRMLLTPGQFVDNEGMTNTNMAELYVNAPRLKIDPNNKKTQFGLIRFKSEDKDGRTWQDYNTGQIYVTDNKGNIIGSTMSEEAAKKGEFSHYYGYQQKDADRQAYISDAQDQVNKHSARVGNGVTKEQLIADINNARAGFANVVNGVVNVPNHLVTGGLKLAFSPDYTWKDYKNGIINPDINNQVIGAGDLFNVENPYANFLLNMANPTSLFISSSNSNMSRRGFRGKELEPGKMQVKVANEPQSRFQVGKGKGRSHNRPVKESRGGWKSDNKGTSVYHHGAGSGSHLETITIPRSTIVTTYTPGRVNFTPTMYYRTSYDNYQAPTLDIIDNGHVETPFISKWQREWIKRGEMPETNAVRWNASPREGVYNTDNTHWRGLSGEGRRYSSTLSNTYNNGQGFTVGYRKGGRVKKFKFV